MLKSNFQSYLEYQVKTPAELALLPEYSNSGSWSALFDTGYQGPLEDTPGLRRIVIEKHSHIPSVQQLIQLRNPVERFFGRLWKL
jgi:hypothetical protein